MLHAITVSIETGWLTAVFSCYAEEGAPCRMTCPNGCEEWDWDHAGTTGHMLVDYGRCVQAEWMENGDWREDYLGDNALLVSGPVEFEWIGDGYGWRYGLDDAKEGSAS